MTLQRIQLNGTLAADAYRSLADLFGFLGMQATIVEGFVQAQTNGATVRIVPRGATAPATGDSGLVLGVNAAIGLGPVQTIDAGVRLDEVWVRNTTAGSNSLLIFWGVLEVGG